MEGVVIVVLLVVGSLCILMQAYISLRATKPRSVETTTTPAAKPGRSKAVAAESEAEESAADAVTGAAKRLGNSVVQVLKEQGAETSTLGMLGVVLLAVAVILVLDLSVVVSFST